MNELKRARPDHPIHSAIVERWSPYGYSDRPVSAADLRSLFEAARWAASSYNEQPWSYILATQANPGEFEAMLSCLGEPNRVWARAAPALALGCARLAFSRNGKPNGVALHDLGLASGNLCLEATARGLCVHQMAGILPDRAREVYGVPEGVQILTALAIGYAADPATLPDELAQRDRAPRARKPLAEFVFSARWGGAAEIAR